MCQFGDSNNIIEELMVTQKNALTGFRNWLIINPFNDKEKYLRALNRDYLWPKNELASGNPLKENSEGIYNHNYNYNNYYDNYYNYNHNSYNHNYNDYNYNYYNYNYYNYNYNNYNHNNYDYNYYNYNICGTCYLHGKIYKYKEGYRSQFAYPKQLVILDDKKWFEDANTIKFAEHFNLIVENIAREYHIEVIGYSDYCKL